MSGLMSLRVSQREFLLRGDFTQYQVQWDDREHIVRCAAADPFGEEKSGYLSVKPRHSVLLEA